MNNPSEHLKGIDKIMILVNFDKKCLKCKCQVCKNNYEESEGNTELCFRYCEERCKGRVICAEKYEDSCRGYINIE